MTKASILVVEDEAIVALDIKVRLERLGYSVPATVGSGEDAIRKVEETQPDLVLIDILLKGHKDGVEAAAEIRDRFDVPVVFMTALSDPQTLDRGKEAKPYGWLGKPVETEQLQRLVEQALSLHRRAKEEVG